MRQHKHQRGATLIVALVILSLLMILGVAATQVSLMQEKMTSNMRDKDLSFQATESAIIQAERWILALAAAQTPSSSCVSPCVHTLDNTLNFTQQVASWWTTNGGGYTNATLSGINTAPRYYIEYNRFVPDNPIIGHGQTTGVHYFRVTGRGSGGSNNSASVIQTTVAKRF